jgi:hypothetical protein
MVSRGDAHVTAFWILVKLPPDGATTYSAPAAGGTKDAIISNTAALIIRIHAGMQVLMGSILFWIMAHSWVEAKGEGGEESVTLLEGLLILWAFGDN